jgi:hypothetical protein
MMTRYMSLGLATLLSCAAFAGDTGTDTSARYTETGVRMADTSGNERRDDRGDDRDDRQDCRQDEGRVGGDKRDCKQDARGDDGDDA